MSATDGILYSTAKTVNNLLVKAIDAQRREDYKCLACDQALILKKGQVKRPHFAHKALTFNCTPETVLHYSFKTLLAEKIQVNIDKKLPLPIIWDCDKCGETHNRNLLKRATQVKIECSLGSVKPDIALLGKDNSTIAVIEVVVSHYPEKKALRFYQENNIKLILYKLQSDQDLNVLQEPELKPTDCSFCLNPACKKCAKKMLKKRLLILEDSCWKCRRLTKIAFTMNGEPYSSLDRLVAHKHGILLQRVYSISFNESFITPKCSHCEGFSGQFYRHNYLVPDKLCRYIIETGFYCSSCPNITLNLKPVEIPQGLSGHFSGIDYLA